MSNETKSAWFGIFVGVIAFAGLLILTETTPKHQLRKDQLDAINHGYAVWVISTNGISPTVEFKWK